MRRLLRHRPHPLEIVLIAGLLLCANILRAQAPAPAAPGQILLDIGKTRILDLPANIERVSVAAGEIAEAVPVSARSLMVNGKGSGETSLIIWLLDGTRREYNVLVHLGAARVEAANRQLADEFGGQVHITLENGSVFLTGRVPDLYAAQRAEAVAATAGRLVNLLKVDVTAQEPQILLKVRFADVDRSKSLSLGVNLFGAPAGYTAATQTGANGSTAVGANSTSGGSSSGSSGSGFSNISSFTLSNALNVLVWDPHANIGATIEALAAKSVLEILAEPNVLAMNGHEASFVSGGEFPFPTLQGGGSGVGQVTVSFREFGIKLRFTPVITPRGTIKLRVAPEVSSLDFANSLTVNGSVVPALTTRKVDTEVELEDGQSFAIAGLLDNQSSEAFSKIPGLGDIPILGKFFQSKIISKSNSELIVIVTPELVTPMHKGDPLPDLVRPDKFIEGPGVLTEAPRTPGPDKTGPVAPHPMRTQVSVQEMENIVRNDANPAATSVAPNGSAIPPGLTIPNTPAVNPAPPQ